MISPKELASILVSNRLNNNSTTEFPSAIPDEMDFSYKVQDYAIDMWESEIVGWKIGRLSPQMQEKFGTERLSGPIFLNRFQIASEINEVSVFDGGFAALEAEYVFEIGKDFPQDGEINNNDFAQYVCAAYAGIEMAGSPIFDINSLGPSVVASDFGNNNGLILGAKLFDINNIEILDNKHCNQQHAASYINDAAVGHGGLFSMPNGPVEAIKWLGKHLAKRGRPLKKGMLISSGAATGIHEIFPNQFGTAIFKNDNDLSVEIKVKVTS